MFLFTFNLCKQINLFIKHVFTNKFVTIPYYIYNCFAAAPRGAFLVFLVSVVEVPPFWWWLPPWCSWCSWCQWWRCLPGVPVVARGVRPHICSQSTGGYAQGSSVRRRSRL